jgi:signal transduction histidine kinase
VDNPFSLTSILFCISTVVAATMAWFYRRLLLRERQIEDLLKFSHENLDFALRSGQMGTWEVRLADSSVICSQEMLDLWEVTAKEYNNNRGILQSKVHPEDLGPMKAAIDKAIATDGIYQMEYRVLPKPGKVRWVFSRGRCTFVPGSRQPERFSGVIFDITESKKREQALNEAIQARDHFLMIAGHELKTPLTSMQLQIQARQRELKNHYPEAFTPEKISLGLNKYLEYVGRLTRLVDSLLTVSQIAESRLQLSYEHFDLYKLVADVADRFPEVKFEGSLPVYGNWDWLRIEQVLMNLLMNAVKYGNKKPIQVSLSPFDHSVQIVVRDHGVGIPKVDQERIFKRFERAISENEASGLGLGLYIAKSIVELHGGQILVKSEAGEGAEFTVILPLEQGRV